MVRINGAPGYKLCLMQADEGTNATRLAGVVKREVATNVMIPRWQSGPVLLAIVSKGVSDCGRV